MNKKTFNVGIVGYGIGKIYAAALSAVNSYYPDYPQIKLSGIATSSKESGEKAMRQFPFQYATQSYEDILNDPDTDAILLCTPNDLHAEMILAAMETDKAIFVDKPLTLNFEEAKRILKISKEKKKDCQLGFEFRYCPAIQKAKSLIEDGKLGKIYSYRINYFRPSGISDKKDLRWKGELARCGDGVINDYGPHIIDLAIWLTELPDRVTARRRIFTPERKGAAGPIKVDTADHYLVLTEVEDGVMGSLETSRMITGSDNDINIEINGSTGALRWSFMQPNYLQFASSSAPYANAWVNLMTGQNYPGAVLPGKDAPVGMMRFYTACLADFIQHALSGENYASGILDGMMVQAFVEASTNAAFSGEWENLPDF